MPDFTYMVSTTIGVNDSVKLIVTDFPPFLNVRGCRYLTVSRREEVGVLMCLGLEPYRRKRWVLEAA